MSQNPLLNNGIQSSKTPGLKPALSAALSSLEVQLDQELTRYRRARTNGYSTHQKSVSSSTSKQEQLTAISTTDPPTPVEENLAVNLPQFAAASAATSVGKESPKEIKTNTKPTSVPDTQLQVPAPDSSKTESAPASVPSDADPKTKSVSAPAPASIVTVVDQRKTENVLNSDDTQKPPNDYLESSEALLRSLTEEQPQTQKRSNRSDLLSPLGIGSMLLLLLASLTLGYVISNPKSWQLSLGGLFGQTPKPASNTEVAQSNAKPVVQPQLTPIPKSPNLATQEFPQVNNPNDVVGLKPKAKPSPPPLPNPVAVQNPINPTTPLPPPVAGVNLPAPTPAATEATPNAQIQPSADGFYHIVTDNQGASGLTQARQIVPDAYLSPDGKLIYLGALKTPEKAQQLLSELQGKGIKAKIQQP